MKTPVDKQITLTLYSYPMSDLKLRWKAQVVFKPGSTDDSRADVSVEDGEGTPVPGGVLEFAGARISVQNGGGALRCGDFARGRHEQAIWLYRRGRVPVPGALTFE